jgi:hypothetical protein
MKLSGAEQTLQYHKNKKLIQIFLGLYAINNSRKVTGLIRRKADTDYITTESII